MLTTEEIVATLRHCATHNCIMCPAYSPPNSKCFETLATACDRLEELSAQPRWIPVTERLPSDPDTYVLCIASGKVNNIELIGAYQLATYNDEDGWELEMFSYWHGAHITHWMPLPKPPKEDNHDKDIEPELVERVTHKPDAQLRSLQDMDEGCAESTQA